MAAKKEKKSLVVLDEKGRKLLAYLVQRLFASDNEQLACVNYADVLGALGVETKQFRLGVVLKGEGLTNLAHWLKKNKKPAITGLIVNKTTRKPSDSYYTHFEKEVGDEDWRWRELKKAKRYSWGKYLQLIEKPGNLVVGDSNPPRRERKSNVYGRNGGVGSEVLGYANGYCEHCKNKGFLKEDKSLYLEVHHVKPLAEGGADLTSNAVAVCANCHRKLHFSANRKQLTNSLYQTIDRLERQAKL